MKSKSLLVTFSILAVAVAVFLNQPQWFGICFEYTNAGGTFCSAPFRYSWGVILFPLTISFLVATAVSLSVSSETFSRWVKFSIGYAIVIAILLYTIPSIGAGAGGFGLTYIDTQGFAVIYAVLYGLTSLILFGVSEILLRKTK